MKSLAEQFLERFAGLPRAYGVYAKTDKPDGEKKVGQAQTLREPLTVEQWEKHLEGTQSLGVVPIRDDATVRFGAIDIDQYNKFNHRELADKIAKFEFPLIVCNTKSGGAHLYLFAREDIPASLLRIKLMEWSAYLGFSGVEIFPKQTRLAGQADIGNWINMPYFGGAKTDRYATFSGKKLTPAEFLKLADGLAVDERGLNEIKAPEKDEFKVLLEEAPPCLVTLAQRGGVDKGARNNGLFNFGVYLRKRFGEGNWEEHLDTYNAEFINPPLGHKEINGLIGAVNKKAYEYKCNDQPICDVCNKQLCHKRKFGVGQGEGDPGVVFGPLLKIPTDPVTWIWDVDGARIELTTIELKDQARFHIRVIEELNKWPISVKPQEWAAVVRIYLEKCEVLEVPEDARPSGQVWSYLNQYCTGQARARSQEELLQKKPWTSEGRVYFHGPHFHSWLTKQGLRITSKQLWNWLRDRGAESHFFNIKGRAVRAWSVKAFDELEGDLSIPNLEEEM